MEILVERKGCEIAFDHSGRMKKGRTVNMTSLYDKDADLEDPSQKYKVENVVIDLRKREIFY